MFARECVIAAGSRVRVWRGEQDIADVPIERIAAGAELVDARGGRHRLGDITRLPREADALTAEVLLRADALAPGVPAVDLRVAPETLLAVGTDQLDGLVPAAALANGGSIVNQPATAPDWFRLTMEAEALVLANGVPVAIGADALPILPPGEALLSLRRALARRGADLRRAAEAGPAITIIAGGQAVATEEPEPGCVVCALPQRSGPVRLGARARRSPDPNDSRPLGVCVLSVELDGRPLALDSSAFGPGFHPVESNAGQSWRWTNGDAWLVLPYSAATRRLVLRINDWHEALPLA